jgi:hypothetical protein
MANPYILYIISFVLSFLFYLLGWSDLYPEITADTVLFFIVTFLISAYLSFTIKKSPLLRYTKIGHNSIIYRLTALSFVAWIADIIYAQSIPLINIVFGIKYSYNEFTGIPTIHVILNGFQIFFCVYLFHLFLSVKNFKILYLYLLNIIPFIIVFSRAALMIITIACLIIYVASKSDQLLSETVKRFIFKILPFALIVLILFGSLGNMRSGSQLDDPDNADELIFLVAEANSKFYNSGVPKILFWSYVYISSPLANLQRNIDMSKNRYPNSKDITSFFVNELLPDFMSKRIDEIFELLPTSPHLITPNLTVGTVYAGSAYYLSWMGLIIMAIFIMILPKLYLNLLIKNDGLYIEGIAVLCSMYSLLIFDNMFKVSGVSMTLVFPLIFSNFLNPQAKKN